VTMFLDCLIYIIVAVVCRAVGALRSSRSGRRRKAVGIRWGGFPAVYPCVG
jgi:hypothetical protein